MLWLNFIHLYQPANSPSHRIKEAVDKSYYRLTRLLEEHADLSFTANISACLLERLRDENYQDLLDRWRLLIKAGRLELVGSAAYHAFLPFLPEEEIIYQIKQQEKMVLEILGVDIRGNGFFSPEMSYTPALARIIKKLGYRWLIVGEASLPDGASISADSAYTDLNSDLKIIVRQRDFSNAYAPDIITDLLNRQSPLSLLITATDAELYGLRHEDPTAELEKMVKMSQLSTKTISDFLNSVTSLTPVKFRSASWETNWPEDEGRPFRIWFDHHNKIQRHLWRLTNLALAAGKKYKDDENYYWYRWHLNRGLASCMFWWASGRDFFHNFGPRAWNPDEVENGLNDLLRSVRSLHNSESRREKLLAERLAAKIRLQLWRFHWRQHWGIKK